MNKVYFRIYKLYVIRDISNKQTIFGSIEIFVNLYNNKTHILNRNLDRVELIHASHVCKI